MIAILFRRFRLLRLHYYVLLSSIHRIYYVAIKILKYDSTAVDFNADEYEMDYLSESSGGKAD